VVLFFTVPRPTPGPTQLTVQWVPAAFSAGIKRPGHKADQLPQSKAELKNKWNYDFTPPYVFMPWCLIITLCSPLSCSLSTDLAISFLPFSFVLLYLYLSSIYPTVRLCVSNCSSAHSSTDLSFFVHSILLFFLLSFCAAFSLSS
jgi:hypothetical protein